MDNDLLKIRRTFLHIALSVPGPAEPPSVGISQSVIYHIPWQANTTFLSRFLYQSVMTHQRVLRNDWSNHLIFVLNPDICVLKKSTQHQKSWVSISNVPSNGNMQWNSEKYPQNQFSFVLSNLLETNGGRVLSNSNWDGSLIPWAIMVIGTVDV